MRAYFAFRGPAASVTAHVDANPGVSLVPPLSSPNAARSCARLAAGLRPVRQGRGHLFVLLHNTLAWRLRRSADALLAAIDKNKIKKKLEAGHQRNAGDSTLAAAGVLKERERKTGRGGVLAQERKKKKPSEVASSIGLSQLLL